MFIPIVTFFQVVLPSKAIRNEQILETLMHQATTGMYRIHETELEEATARLQNQDSFMESFDYSN